MIVDPLLLPSELHGLRLDQALSRLMPQYSRSQWAHWIKEKKITVNGKSVLPKDKVLTKDLITFSIEAIPSLDPPQYLPEAIPLDIVYEDSDILVINKPAGLVVHPGAGVAQGTLVNALIHHNTLLSNLPRAGIIHRLDKETTGLLLVAKTLVAYTDLVRKMQERRIHREYIALVQGSLTHGAEINTFYGRHPLNRLKMAVTKAGKEAITHYFIQKHFQYCTLLRVRLQTGRTHQIRVHMRFINHPIVGDPLYGKKLILPKDADSNLKTALETFPRQALHAAQLSFFHPVTQNLLTLEADLPQDFAYLLSLLEMTDDYE